MDDPEGGGMLSEAQFIDRLIEHCLQDHFKSRGIEGTEDMIKRVYSSMPIARARFLSVYKRLITGGVR